MLLEPFHEGERRVQERAGEIKEADQNSPMIATRIPVGAIPFLREQPLLVLAILDNDAMWCLPVIGKAGWMSESGDAIRLNLEQIVGKIDDRVLHAAENCQFVGGLVLDFATRRRLRINGRLGRTSDKLMVLTVAEAFPNCPKYITQRSLVWFDKTSQAPLRKGNDLTESQRDALRKTDVLFLATQHPERGPDASHRGGNPGFVESPSNSTLRFTDYVGNSLFNTLGNLEIDARIGLLCPDFSTGHALAVTGTASVSYEDQGRTRRMTVAVQSWTEVRLPAKETARQLSPFNG